MTDTDEARQSGRRPVERSGRSVLITGASRGIGRATVECFARNGWTVFAGVRNPGSDATLAGHRDVRVVSLDVCDAVSVQRAADEIRELTGGLDVVINNAAVMPVGPLTEMDPAEIRRVLATNLEGAALVARATIPLLRGRPGGGVLVNVGSLAGRPHSGPPLMALYNTTKAALVALAYQLNKELAVHGVRCCAVELGPWDTDGLAGILAATKEPWPHDGIVAERLRAVCAAIGAIAGDARTAAEGLFAIASNPVTQVTYALPVMRAQAADAAAQMTDPEFLALCAITDPSAWLMTYRHHVEARMPADIDARRSEHAVAHLDR